MCIHMDGTQLDLPPKSELLTDNGISQVYRGNDGWIYKRSIPFLIENELYFFKKMLDGENLFVPFVTRHDKYTIAMEDLGESEPVTHKGTFLFNMGELLKTLYELGIRHGDLTRYAIIVKDDHPWLIDFAESRLIDDPRPDKRKEGDFWWCHMTYNELTKDVE